MRLQHLRWATVAALALTAACSSGESTDDTSDAVEAETTDPPESTTTTEAPATTTTEAPTTTTTTTEPPATTAAPATTSTAPPADSGDDVIPTDGLAAAFDTLTGSLDLENDATVDFSRCPLDPDGEIMVSIFGDPAIGLAPEFVGPAINSGAFDVGSGFGPMVYCDRFADESFDGVGLFAISTPDDLEAYTTAFVNPGDSTTITTDITPRGEVRGGLLDRICVSHADEPELDYCELQWASGGVSIGAYVNGFLTTTVDLDAFEQSFVAQLDRLVAALAGT